MSTLLGKSLNSFQLAADFKDEKRTFSSTNGDSARGNEYYETLD